MRYQYATGRLLPKPRPKTTVTIYLASVALLLTTMCLYARAQRPETSGPALSGVSKDTSATERDTIRLDEVVVSTGYQTLSKRHTTGSFDYVGNTLLNRRIGADVLERLENITTGLSYATPGESSFGNPGRILIRGRNSIYSNVAPLVVVDNFPYDGDIGNLNPNDVESVTILKDAAAAAQWGARAGNGVIVITTKRGVSARPNVAFNANATVQGRPDLHAVPTISSADYIELERYHFDRGYYDGDLSAITPATA